MANATLGTHTMNGSNCDARTIRPTTHTKNDSSNALHPKTPRIVGHGLRESDDYSLNLLFRL
jgi:hypothetical protein